MSGQYGEDALVEQPMMRLLAELEWEVSSGFDEHPGAGGPIGRSNFMEVIFEDHCAEQCGS